MQLSQLPQFLNNTLSFDVPVYTVWGACEDVTVLEKLRMGDYKVDKLHIIDEGHTQLLEVGGVKLRLLGLGGAVVMHKLFDNGEGKTTIAGGQGTMWTTLLQMGELVDTATRHYDPSEIRVLVTHASPAREGLLNQLSVNLKVDFSISAGLHFRYGSSYNEFSVNPTLDHYRGKLAASRASFYDVWETVKSEVEPAVAENDVQQKLLNYALDVVGRMPSVANGGNPFGGQTAPTNGQVDEVAFKNMWNFNLADSQFGHLVLEVENGRIGTEMRAQGFNFAHRVMKAPAAEKTSVQGIQGQSAPQAGGYVQQVPQVSAYAQSSGPPFQQGQPQVRPGQSQQPRPHHQSQQQASVGRGAPSSQPAPQTSQPQNKAPSAPASGAVSGRPAASPAPPAASPATAKPISDTPAPQTTSSTPSNVTTDKIAPAAKAAVENKVNGTETAPATEPAKNSTPPVERKPSQGLFITNVNSEEEAKGLFSEEDRSKIVRVDKMGRNFVAQFSSPEEMQTVLKAVAPELRKGNRSGEPPHASVKIYEDRSNRTYNNSNSWNNPRGGLNNQGGYRGATPGEGEAGRGGRGGFRGGRGRGDGTRGRGRGGRGGFGKPEGDATSSTPTPAAATSTPVAAPAAAAAPTTGGASS